MASERTERLCTCLPAMTLTLNAVRPGEAQRPHRHNAAALVLALREARCASEVDSAAPAFEVGEPRRRAERRHPAKIELFQARQLQQAIRQSGDRIAAEIDLAKLDQ